jgi:hypothetical protein
VALPIPLLLAPVVFAAAIYWQLKRSRAILDKWAGDNNVQIVKSRYRFLKGPFPWPSSQFKDVFFVNVRDLRDGSCRSGWVGCGLGLFGYVPNGKVDVIWKKD